MRGKYIVTTYMTSPGTIKTQITKNKMEIWFNRSIDLHMDLLFSMSQALGYHFDKVLLKKGSYTPQGHADLENDYFLLRRGALDILYGKRPIPIIPWGTGTPAESGTKKIEENK